VNEAERALGRTNLRQAELIAIPWILLQFGLFGFFAWPWSGDGGIWIVGGVMFAVVLVLAFRYCRGEAELANLRIREMDADIEYYGAFTWFRQWGDQLELVRTRCPGYLNTLRLNYILLPLALLAFMLQFWIAAFLLLPLWLVTGMLVRSAMARAVWKRDIPASYWLGILLLVLAAFAAWGGAWFAAGRMEREYHAGLKRMNDAGAPVNVRGLTRLYRLYARNGADLVKELGEVPDVPVSLKRTAFPVLLENVSPGAYAEMEKYVFRHRGLMEKLTEIEQIRTARLDYEFEGKSGGVAKTRPLIARYRRLFGLEQLRLLSAANAGDDREVVESWIAMGNLRRQLSGEPSLPYARNAMELEMRRIGVLERIVNEFGLHSGKARDELEAELSRTEMELTALFRRALRGEMALSVISGFRRLDLGPDIGLSRLFPALRWGEYRSRESYLEGLDQFSRAAGEPLPATVAGEWCRALPFGAVPAGRALLLVDGYRRYYVGLLRKVRAARIGLALDRYRLAHGGFPASLSELDGLPPYLLTDPETGNPMRYVSGFDAAVCNASTGGVRTVRMDGVEVGDRGNGFCLRR